MIASLRGLLREKRPPHLVLEVGGVGYELEAPMPTFYDLPGLDREVFLFTHLVVREDAHQLFGFAKRRDRDVFRLLLRVNGVGAKLALAILSGMDAERLARAVLEADTAALSRLPGIGKKTAERLVIEMRDRLDAADGAVQAAAVGVSVPPAADDPVAEAVSALVSLGFKPPEASRRVQAVAEPGLSREDLLRRALQSVVR
ncbi:MAG: Holliday junction branch migration protein RuvA [Ectothiorhodospiraceae bacterium]|nr:Holliday junction branch migration protein RuvA [Ectothiorhodospiraceae bacterium]